MYIFIHIFFIKVGRKSVYISIKHDDFLYQKSPKLMTRFVCITYANDLVGKAFQFITDYKRLIVLAKPASLWDKSGVSFPIQLFMFMYCYRLWFIYINYFKRRNESKEIVLFHQNFEKFVGEEKIGVVKVKCGKGFCNIFIFTYEKEMKSKLPKNYTSKKLCKKVLQILALSKVPENCNNFLGHYVSRKIKAFLVIIGQKIETKS